MKFRVGPHLYTVRISQGQLRDSGRVAVDGLCCWSDTTIWINECLPLAQRVTVLFHELAHAWEMEFGIPSASEDHANWVATFTRDVLQQLNGYGGIDALLRLRSDGVIDDAQSEETPNQSYKIQCGNEACKEQIAIGSVQTSAPRFDPMAQRPAVTRSVTCPHCSTKMSWTEGVTSGGLPNGRVLAGPMLRKSRRALAHSLVS